MLEGLSQVNHNLHLAPPGVSPTGSADGFTKSGSTTDTRVSLSLVTESRSFLSIKSILAAATS